MIRGAKQRSFNDFAMLRGMLVMGRRIDVFGI